MSKYSIEDTTLTSIGNAIRTKEGTSDPIAVTDLATRIAALSGGVSLADCDVVMVSNAPYDRYNTQRFWTTLTDYFPTKEAFEQILFLVMHTTYQAYIYVKDVMPPLDEYGRVPYVALRYASSKNTIEYNTDIQENALRFDFSASAPGFRLFYNATDSSGTSSGLSASSSSIYAIVKKENG